MGGSEPMVTEEMLMGTVPLIDAVTEPICAVPAPIVTVPAPTVTVPPTVTALARSWVLVRLAEVALTISVMA